MDFRIVRALRVCCPTNLCFRESSPEQGDPPEQRSSSSALEITAHQPKAKPQKSSSEPYRPKYTVTLNEPGCESPKVLYSPASGFPRQQRHWTQAENSTMDTFKQNKEDPEDS